MGGQMGLEPTRAKHIGTTIRGVYQFRHCPHDNISIDTSQLFFKFFKENFSFF